MYIGFNNLYNGYSVSTVVDYNGIRLYKMGGINEKLYISASKDCGYTDGSFCLLWFLVSGNYTFAWSDKQVLGNGCGLNDRTNEA